MFSLLALVCLEQARLVLGWLAFFVWFGWFGCLFWFCLLCCALVACFAMLSLLGLLCYATKCNASIGRFHMVRLGFCPLGLVWLGRLASWHTLDFEK